jgi:hypothetical protein
MRPSTLALGLVCGLVLAPAAAHADPVTTNIFTSSPGFVADASSFSVNGPSINLGDILFSGGAEGYIYIQGLAPRGNYIVSFSAHDSSGNTWNSLSAEVLDPLSDGHDAMDLNPQPGYVPGGYSTSNNTDGLSFAWNSGIRRSAVFAHGGEASLFVDEDTNDHDLLAFNGFNGDVAMVNFGLRDNSGGRGFLLRLSVDGGADPGAQTPEPASMLLLGTGLLGLARARQRRGTLAR